MVFVSVVFLVTLKLSRERKKVSLLSLKFCFFFLLVRVEELQLFLFSLV